MSWGIGKNWTIQTNWARRKSVRKTHLPPSSVYSSHCSLITCLTLVFHMWKQHPMHDAKSPYHWAVQRNNKNMLFSLWVSLWHMAPFGALIIVYERRLIGNTRIKQQDISTTKITQKRALSSRLLVFLLMSPVLSRLGHGFSWRWAFIMVWSEMKGTPNINMALLLAYSDVSVGSEREKSLVKKAAFSCLNIWLRVLFCIEREFVLHPTWHP